MKNHYSLTALEKKALREIKKTRIKKSELKTYLKGYFLYSKICNPNYVIDQTLKNLEKKNMVKIINHKNNQIYYEITSLGLESEKQQC